MPAPKESPRQKGPKPLCPILGRSRVEKPHAQLFFEEANDLLHVAQYREDKGRFLAQLPQPSLQVSYVLGPNAARHAQAEADQGRRELCDQLLAAVSRRRRLAQMAVETARRAGRVGDFIRNLG